MDELTFDGIPLPIPPAPPAPQPAPPPTVAPASAAPPPAAPAQPGPPADLAGRLAARLQEAHAAVLGAHEAITAWQLSRAPRGRTAARLPYAPAPGTGEGPSEGAEAVVDAVSQVLRALATAPHAAEAAAGTGTATTATTRTGGTNTATGTGGTNAAACTSGPTDMAEAAEPGRTGGTTEAGRTGGTTEAAGARAEAGVGAGAVLLSWQRPIPPVPAGLRVAATDRGRQVLEGRSPLAGLTRVEPADAQERPWPPRPVLRYPPDPRPPARTTVARLAAAELDALAAGRFRAVLGAAFDQSGLPPEALPAPWPARLLADLALTGPRDGAHAQGRLLATTRPAADTAKAGAGTWAHLVAAALEALRVYVFWQGFHLCVPGARATPSTGRPVRVETLAPAGTTGAAGSTRAAGTTGPAVPPGAVLHMELHVSATGLLPLPYATADCQVTVGGRPLARLWDLGVTLVPAAGTEAMGWERRSPRTTASGRRAELDELQIAFLAEGDHGAVRLPGLPRVSARVRPRLPRGDFRLVDRMTRRPQSGGYRPGTEGAWEYDVPPDPWFVRENNGTLPQLALMEAALQPAGGFSGALGISGEYPDRSLSCRNLTGRARLLEDVELRGTTVEQRTVLRAHSPLPGGIMHRYDFSLSTGGRTFYTGEAVHGFLTPELLAGHQGLDGDAPRRPWLDDGSPAPGGVLRLHPAGDTRLGRGRLALLQEAWLVPEGGEHGAGYVLCEKPVRADDWFFEQHFPHDPVLPGSVSVQMLYQAVHAFALGTGLLDGLPEPRMHVAVGEELRWSYRGQILREHRRVRGEVHVREVRREGDRVLVRADGSVWRDEVRIYQVENLAADFRAALRGAQRGGA
ncbi:hypothetical protein GCM10018793_23180 [Streptomyces sulfonofaciens]|uniref:Trans-2-decenoyl-[acyl-carrier-protein] isomerase n=1 Tax=Streptomyces sulfonofaciens TaxID=68272 RepID=A0A919G3A5_9ACTN|nr:hypothetical protein [Streptomyces sulfonofaciens]GHH76743.1 hypothetical protein GCM10018793_23180 [Streptomyces sulfonofaciens]